VDRGSDEAVLEAYEDILLLDVLIDEMEENSPRCACRRWLEWARGSDLQVYGWATLAKAGNS